MTINEIELINFRLHKKTKLNFSESINFIVGGNGQGKTSVLEAIYYLATTKNMLQASECDAVNFESTSFKILGDIKGLVNNSAVLYYDKDTNKKNYLLDGKQINKSADIIGKFPIVTITPGDHAITQGSPADRRRFVDSVISQTSGAYLNILLDYNKTLKQRSSLLNQISLTGNRSLLNELDIWSENLVNLGTEIINHRFLFAERFTEYIISTYEKLLGEKEIPNIEYLTYGHFDKNNVKNDFFSLLNVRREDELRRCANLVGPHRDDFLFRINNLELKKFGSQGQHKTFQVALKFGQFFYIKDILNSTPVFLMDDVFGELDTFRSESISRYLKNIGQSFITATDFSNIGKLDGGLKSSIFTINNGSLS